MSKLIISLNIPKSEYLKWYSGAATSVIAKTDQGLRINFPANILKPFITHAGVNGSFAIEFDDNNRFVNIEKI